MTQSPVWGLGRVIALEHPEFLGGLIDLDDDTDEDDQISLLYQEIGDDDPRCGGPDSLPREPALCTAVGPRALPTTGRPTAQLPSSATSMLFKPDGTYLITGGLGKLGLAVAQWMTVRGARHLVLISRRRLPDRSAWDTLSAGSDAHDNRVANSGGGARGRHRKSSFRRRGRF